MKNYQKLIFLFFVIYSITSTILYSKSSLLKGDEVHYLITSESLLRDGDLYLENNYSIDTIGKFGYSKLDKHTVIGIGGHEILGHGLTFFPIVLAPFYFVSGRLGVSLFLSLVAILLFRQTVKLTLLVIKRPAVVWFVSLCLFLTLPLAQASLLVFPDVLAGLIIVYCLYEVFTREKLSLLSGILIGLLPYIHFRFLTVSVFFVLFWILKQFKKRTKMLLLPPILILIYYLTSSYMFGSFDINKSFMAAPTAYEGNIITSVVNLLVDRQYGLIPNNPVFILAIPGMYFWFKAAKQKAFLGLLLIGFALLPILNSSDWHGGFAPPARYLTSIIPVIVPAIAITIEKVKTLLVKSIWFFGFSWGLTVYLINLLTTPNHGYLYKDGLTPYLNKLSVISGVYLYRLFPGYFPDEKFSILHLIWVGLVLFIAFWIVKASRGKNPSAHI